MAQVDRKRATKDQELIERYIDLDWERYGRGRADAWLKDYGVSVWALIAYARANDADLDELAAAYELPRDAVDAALAYYRQNKKYIEARLLVNEA